MRAKCKADGIYNLDGKAVIVKDGDAGISTSALAGSVLKMNHCLKHLLEYSRKGLTEI
ncbi:hypothetical protein [Macrococcoides canis]|uniref:hypothetical protein n=1 Tax=Macrococcoides canis TaxID=1855823 RepID=UPI00140B287A|nr:hypothetical protein [Macrococcus canis]MEE1107176.1 hypothetical protein [Macrococcus canis]